MPNSGNNFKFFAHFSSNLRFLSQSKAFHFSTRPIKTFLKINAIMTTSAGESMNHRLLDALDLLKMLEVVFEQRQALELNGENHSKSGSNTFPWSGVRLTLRQSRELLQDLSVNQESPKVNLNKTTAASHAADAVSFEQAVSSQNNQRSKVNKEPVNVEVGDKNYRGTFNRIQLTQEPQAIGSEEQAVPAAR